MREGERERLRGRKTEGGESEEGKRDLKSLKKQW